ncbi:hypothetical protein ROS1_28690 [Roseibium sp. ROS1]
MPEKDVFNLHVTEIGAVLDRGNAKYIASLQLAAAYGQIALRSALVLNGGALFAGLAFMGAIAKGDSLQSISTGFFAASACFVFGIFGAALGSFAAYKNFIHGAEWIVFDTEIEATEKSKKYFSSYYMENREEYENTQLKNTNKRDDVGKKLDQTALFSTVLGISSYIFFTVGCIVVGGTVATA